MPEPEVVENSPSDFDAHPNIFARFHLKSCKPNKKKHMLNPRDGIRPIWYQLIKWAPQTHPKMTIFRVQVATANLSRDSEWQGLAGFSAKNDRDILISGFVQKRWMYSQFMAKKALGKL
jgi:hypothetical protein